MRIYYIRIGGTQNRRGKDGWSYLLLPLNFPPASCPFGSIHAFTWVRPHLVHDQRVSQPAEQLPPHPPHPQPACASASSASPGARLRFAKCAWDDAPAAAPWIRLQNPWIKLTRHQVRCVRVRRASTPRTASASTRIPLVKCAASVRWTRACVRVSARWRGVFATTQLLSACQPRPDAELGVRRPGFTLTRQPPRVPPAAVALHAGQNFGDVKVSQLIVRLSHANTSDVSQSCSVIKVGEEATSVHANTAALCRSKRAPWLQGLKWRYFGINNPASAESKAEQHQRHPPSFLLLLLNEN